ncbi:MAG: sulfatase-like hydrolase/transferase [Rickettsiales bacterium]|jgi:phosphoglycerol transferase|nr:sulfatase-like hydrolase/transferase [Rickettsiales bacterium]
MAKRNRTKLYFAAYFLMFFLALGTRWINKEFNIAEIAPVLMTVLAGADIGDWNLAFAFMRKVVLLSAVLAWLAAMLGRRTGRPRAALGAISVLFAAIAVCFGIMLYGIPENRGFFAPVSQFYEENYTDPRDAGIEFAQKRSVVILQLESMEASYADEKLWGRNLIPGLSRLARENISFALFASGRGTNNTVMALAGATCGVPLTFSGKIEWAAMKMLRGAKCIGDILAENGYENRLFMSGKASFSSIDDLFLGHGFSRAVDMRSLERSGIKPAWRWGADDADLAAAIKPEIEELAASGRPYAAFVSFMNTHNPKGLLSSRCDGDPDDFRDIAACNDKIAAEFIEWLRSTDPDAAIVVFGDHAAYPNGLEGILGGLSERPLLNIIINGPKVPVNGLNRRFLAYDLMPTIVELAGGRWGGGRLGIGTSLYSGKKTLLETTDFDKLQTEQTAPNKLYGKLMLGDGK